MNKQICTQKHTIVMPISPGTHPDSSPYSSTNILPRYRKHEWGLVPYTLTIWLQSEGQLTSNTRWTMQPNTDLFIYFIYFLQSFV